MKSWWLITSVVFSCLGCFPRKKSEPIKETVVKVSSPAEKSGVNVVTHGSDDQLYLDSLKKAKLKTKHAN